jgi:hypothetical protein
MRKLQIRLSLRTQLAASSDESPTNLGLLLLYEKGPLQVSLTLTLTDCVLE